MELDAMVASNVDIDYTATRLSLIYFRHRCNYHPAQSATHWGIRM